MEKHVLRWKSVRLMSVCGNPYIEDELPSKVAAHYRGELLPRILQMTKKKPISFEVAMNMASDFLYAKTKAGQVGEERGQNRWCLVHFVEFISERGYHIQLTGDEFESASGSSN